MFSAGQRVEAVNRNQVPNDSYSTAKIELIIVQKDYPLWIYHDWNNAGKSEVSVRIRNNIPFSQSELRSRHKCLVNVKKKELSLALKRFDYAKRGLSDLYILHGF